MQKVFFILDPLIPCCLALQILILETCYVTRKLGFTMFLRSSLNSWKFLQHTNVSRNIFEAEYKASANLTCKIQWLQYLFKDPNVSFSQSTYVYCDNNSTINLAHNINFQERSKHIKIDYHLIRENIYEGPIKLFCICTSSQIADFLTKPLFKYVFKTQLSKLGLLDLQVHLAAMYYMEILYIN